MISLAALRIAGAVVAATVALGVLYYVADLIREAGRNEVWATVNKAIESANVETAAANIQDANELAMREKLRASALAAAAKVQGGPCKLTAEEATAIGAIR